MKIALGLFLAAVMMFVTSPSATYQVDDSRQFPICKKDILTELHQLIVNNGIEMLRTRPEASFTNTSAVGPKNEWAADYTKAMAAYGIGISTSPIKSPVGIQMKVNLHPENYYMIHLYTYPPVPESITYCLTEQYLVVTADRQGAEKYHPYLTYVVSLPTKTDFQCLKPEEAYIGKVDGDDPFAILPLYAKRTCIDGM